MKNFGAARQATYKVSISNKRQREWFFNTFLTFILGILVRLRDLNEVGQLWLFGKNWSTLSTYRSANRHLIQELTLLNSEACILEYFN